jgi:hypothetical protein
MASFGTFAGGGAPAALDGAVGSAGDPVGVEGTVALTLGGGAVVAEADARGDRDSSGVGGLPLHPASPQAITIHTTRRMGPG